MNENKMSEESFFSFTLGRGIFSVPVRYVKEVFTFEEITPIPNSLDYMKGVMNVRGSVVSIADFRLLFGFNPSSDLSETQVIILEIPQVNDKYVLLGILADKVDVVSPLRMIQADSKDYGIPEDKAHFINAVANNKYPSPPARDLYLVSNGVPKNPAVKAFLKYVLTDGQKENIPIGYIDLEEEKLNSCLSILNQSK